VYWKFGWQRWVKKDEYENYIDETLINTDFKAGSLLSIQTLAKDDSFNKALFQMVNSMDSKTDITMLLAPLTDTHAFASLIAFPDIYHTNYDDKDMDLVLQDLIEKFKTKEDSATRAEDEKVWHNVVSLFTDLYNLYQDIKGTEDQKILEQRYIENLTQKLYEDLICVISTGMTKSEVESLQAMIARINKLIESSKEKDLSESKVKNLIEKLEKEIEKLQDRISDQKEIEIEEDLEVDNSEGLSGTMKAFKSMVMSLQETLEKIKQDGNKNSNNTQTPTTEDQLKLREELVNNQI